MSNEKDAKPDDAGDPVDPLDSADKALSPEVPAGVDRRKFIMRSAVISAAAVLNGCSRAETERKAPPPAPATPEAAGTAGTSGAAASVTLSPDLDVVKKSKGPVMTTVDEFYKVGPGPSSSHTIGPMRITYDFYQRCTKLPADQLAQATALKVYLFGSLSATGKGHGTERAALAGLVGKEPATVDPAFLDSLRDKPDQSFPVKLGAKTVNVTLKDIVYDAPKGNFPHPNTMTCKLMAGDKVLLEQEYYSVGGGFIEWKGYTPPKKGEPKYPYSTMKELRAARREEQPLDREGHPGERDVGLGEKRSGSLRLRRQDHRRDGRHREIGARPAGRRAARSSQAEDQSGDGLQAGAGREVPVRPRESASLSAYALAGSEENGRGHLVVTAPTGGSAGVLPALVYGLGEGGRKLPPEKIRDGMLAAAAIGYLCKHNATLSAAEGGCQAEIGVASAMAAALIASAHDASPRVTENAAESALEHHLGMTCDPVAGYVQIPCIERCAFGAVKAWTAWAIASNEIAASHRVGLDETITAMAQTAKEMNSKYKETSEAGLALSVTLC